MSYVRNRKQRVKIGTSRGEWIGINKVTAQGSIFGQFIYNVLTNDLMYIIQENVELLNYADDNTLICAGDNYDEAKNGPLSSINKVMAWFEGNYMKVNSEKFQ